MENGWVKDMTTLQTTPSLQWERAGVRVRPSPSQREAGRDLTEITKIRLVQWPQGLTEDLDHLRQAGYVRRIFTYYYNMDLPLKNYFRPSAKGEGSYVESGFSNRKAITKFDVVTTARIKGERDAVLADLNERVLE
jgi:hypothetical protein